MVGGCSKLPGVVERVRKEVLQMRPFKSEFNVALASDGVLDAWRGAELVARSGALVDEWSVSRQEWLECAERSFKESLVSNRLLKEEE